MPFLLHTKKSITFFQMLFVTIRYVLIGQLTNFDIFIDRNGQELAQNKTL